MDIIKLDDITKYRKNILSFDGEFGQLAAVDAICINNNNEWFFIEFKNSNIGNTKTRKSIIKKMVDSLWYLFFIYSKSGEDVESIFLGDITKFAREHFTYIIVGSKDKNLNYSMNIQALESAGNHYTPPAFREFVGYYFKDIYHFHKYNMNSFR